MPTLPTSHKTFFGTHRDRCYGCFRPVSECFCELIPCIDNKTEVLILQHMRERFHPFNTARIVHRGLRNSSLLVDHTRQLASRIALKPGAGLLYPGPGATLLADLPASQRPKQLVVVDGTWHNTKTLVRDVPALRSLPQYRLAPVSPSRYRIRREPGDTFLSTVEATVAALRELEPDTRGLDQLLRAFDHMVERQLAHPRAELARRHLGRRSRTIRNIPWALLGDLDNVVAAYGESPPGEHGSLRSSQLPIYWVAERLGTGEQFACLIRQEGPLSESFLGHLDLTSAHFSAALTPDESRASWGRFQRPGDIVAVYNQGTARLLRQISGGSPRCLVLRSVDFHPGRRYGTFDELVAAEGLTVTAAEHPGRAGSRLAKTAALVYHLNALGKAAIQMPNLRQNGAALNLACVPRAGVTQ